MTLTERIAALHEGPMFLDTNFLWKTVFPQILWAFVTLNLIYVTLLYVGDRWRAKGTSLAAKRKASYQLTNLCANVILGISGIYFQYFVLPKNPTVEETTQGLENVVFISTFQFGYQLWAIPIGVFYVRESPAMLVHHLSVIVISSAANFLRNGFRYWAPFFFGLIEISSIPLAIMNFFKDHPVLIDQYPIFYKNLRIVFALTFLQVRVIMYLPRAYILQRDQYLLMSTHPSMLYRIYMSLAASGLLTLLALQMYWGLLISKGLAKTFLLSSPTKVKAV